MKRECVKVKYKSGKASLKMLIELQNVQESDTTKDDSSNADDNIIIASL
jgi:hypothetical protein